MWPFNRQMKTDASEDESGINQQAIIDCPRCKKGMKKIVRNGVVIDFCPLCHGMWLDHGELTKLIDLHESGQRLVKGAQTGKHLNKKSSSRKK